MEYWIGKVKAYDDFGSPIVDIFYDAKTIHGSWAIMSPESFAKYRINQDGKLGTGLGQKYVRQPDGKWLKTEG